MTRDATARDGASICFEPFGSAAEPAIAFVAGSAQSMDWWDAELCERIAATGRLVVRFDQRDSGASTSYPVGEPGYTGADLAADVVAVLDALGVERAHVAGLSSGGGVAQRVALDHPGRVAALTLMSTTPVTGDFDLSAPAPFVMNLLEHPDPDPDWTDRAAAVDRMVEDERPYAGPGQFDEAWVRATAGRAFDRTRDVAASRVNHFLAPGGPASTRGLEDIDVPTLVLHGSADPLFGPDHGRALAAAIPGARFHLLDDLGHQQPPPARWAEFAELLVGHDDGAGR